MLHGALLLYPLAIDLWVSLVAMLATVSGKDTFLNGLDLCKQVR